MQNLYKPKFTYIIPFRYSKDRIIPFRRTIEWLSGFQGIEILVIEQDKVSKIAEMNLKIRHIFVESDAPFNKGWAYNIAIRRTTSNVLVFGDADFIMNPNEMIEGLKSLEFYDCVIPTKSVCRLNHMETNADLPQIFTLRREEYKFNLCDGMSIFKRDTIQKIGGWNEDILGGGYVNKFQDLKIKKMLNYKQMDYLGYHLYHLPIHPDHQLIQRNQNILEHYQKPDSDLVQHINSTVPKSGYLNKYQN
jgi:glycosyltransferase involved in cell wall biosynthesis